MQLKKRLLITLFLPLFAWAQSGEYKMPLYRYAQLDELHPKEATPIKYRTKNAELKNFPFIDHFDSDTLYDSLWFDKNVTVQNHAVVFNAINANGQPYGTGSYGLCDELNSEAIDLNGSRGTLYFFFKYSTGTTWQNGDSLVLELLTPSGNYKTLWTSPDAVNSETDVILMFDINEYLDPNFRFRFVCYAEQSASNNDVFKLHDIVLADKWQLPAHENGLQYAFRYKQQLAINWSIAPVEIVQNGPLQTKAFVLNSFDANGLPYAAASGQQGYTDTLQSHLMDMLTFANTDSVFLRFYYASTQRTRSTDTLVLELRNNTGVWIRVWQGGRLPVGDTYSYQQLAVNFGRFRHQNFQFRFTVKGTYSTNDSAQFLLGGIHLGQKVYLPFIDDFSATTIFPDPKKWKSKSTYINAEFPINPPSINVATFDGLNHRGQPYGVGKGLCDTLQSYSFNLNGLTVADSVYLSFFIQPKGFGETPNSDDSLLLQIRNNPCIPDQYITIWSTGPSRLPRDTFTRIDILLDNPAWFHDDFEFRIRNIGNRSGNINHWHVDYVRLDRARQRNDAYFDVAITSKPGSLLNKYYSMPWSHFLTNPTQFLKTEQVLKVRNNNSANTTITYSRVVRDPLNAVVDSFANLIGNFSSVSDSAITIVDGVNLSGSFTNDTVTFVSRYTSVITSSSDFIITNDLVTVPTNFSNFYAYDDGSAESGYGIDIEPGGVALAYDLLLPDTLFGISMFFNRAYADVTNRTFDLMVWSGVNTNGNGTGQSVLKRVALQSPQYLYQYNGFYYFKFAEPLALPAGKFYIGWDQDQIFNLNVGWDENFEIDGKPAVNPNLAYRINDFWYNSQFKGTPMLRPIVGKWIDPPTGTKTVLTANNSNNAFDVVLYPNPTQHYVSIQSNRMGFLKVELLDLTGKLLLTNAIFENRMELPPNLSGVYLIRVHDEEGNQVVKKLVIQQ